MYLADAFERLSDGRYGKMFLAQNKVQQKVTHQIIKDQDLMGLLQSDVALFAFDGVELDSGTVTEFVAAKFLDIPAVVYRTDFRGGSGEQAIDDKSNRWNLMVSFYPRTKIVYLNGMVEYQKIYTANKGKSVDTISRKYCEHIARKLIEAMDSVVQEPSLLKESEKPGMKEVWKKLLGITYK